MYQSTYVYICLDLTDPFRFIPKRLLYKGYASLRRSIQTITCIPKHYGEKRRTFLIEENTYATALGAQLCPAWPRRAPHAPFSPDGSPSSAQWWRCVPGRQPGRNAAGTAGCDAMITAQCLFHSCF